MDTMTAISNVPAPPYALSRSTVEKNYEDFQAIDSRSFQHIEAPTREPTSPGNKTIFLSGSTQSSKTNWQVELAQDLAHLPVTVFNPLRVSHCTSHILAFS
jgi:hypothetical protein